MRTTCIVYPAREPIAILRRSLALICKGNQCAAMLLNNFIYWHDNKLSNASQEIAKAQDNDKYKPDISLWVYKSAEDLQEDLLGAYGRNKVLSSMKELVTLGFVISKPDKANVFSRRRYFQLKPDKVQTAMISEGLILTARRSETVRSTQLNETLTGLDLNYLPYIEITPESSGPEPITDGSNAACWACHGRGEIGIGSNKSKCGICRGKTKEKR